MKRKIIYLEIMATICLLWSGCEKKQPGTEINHCVYWTVSESKKLWMEEQVEKWNEQYPNKPLDMEIQVIAKDLIDEKLWSTLHSGILQLNNGVPDLVDIEYQNMEKYVAPYNCMLYPLEQIVTTYEEKYGENKIFDGYVYRDICFGIPEGSGRMAIVYQTDALEACKINCENITSIEEFEKSAKEYFECTGNYFCSVDMGHYYFFLSLLLQEQQKGKSIEGAYQRTLEKIQDLYDENEICMMEGGRSDSRSFLEAFSEGRIASVYLPVSAVNDFIEKLGGISCTVQDIPGEKVSIPEFAAAVTIVSEKYSLMQEFLSFAMLEGELQSNKEFWDDKELQTQNTEEIRHYLEIYELELAQRLLNE